MELANQFVSVKQSEYNQSLCLWLQRKHARSGSEGSDATAVPAWTEEKYEVVSEIIQEATQCGNT
jgi:uncharacterized protein YrzB (UPF0473 family)